LKKNELSWVVKKCRKQDKRSDRKVEKIIIYSNVEHSANYLNSVVGSMEIKIFWIWLQNKKREGTSKSKN